MSGLHLLKIDDNIVVQSVDEGSPAALAGVEPDDIITKVDEIDAAEVSLHPLRQSLSDQDGR